MRINCLLKAASRACPAGHRSPRRPRSRGVTRLSRSWLGHCSAARCSKHPCLELSSMRSVYARVLDQPRIRRTGIRGACADVHLSGRGRHEVPGACPGTGTAPLRCAAAIQDLKAGPWSSGREWRPSARSQHQLLLLRMLKGRIGPYWTGTDCRSVDGSPLAPGLHKSVSSRLPSNVGTAAKRSRASVSVSRRAHRRLPRHRRCRTKWGLPQRRSTNHLWSGSNGESGRLPPEELCVAYVSPTLTRKQQDVLDD